MDSRRTKRNKWTVYLVVQLIMLFVGCDHEMEMVEGSYNASSARIYITGGGLENLAAQTKGYVGPGENDEPTNGTAPDVSGICRADRINAFVYSSEAILAAGYPNYNKYNYEQTVTANKLNIVGNDRWTNMQATSAKPQSLNYKYLLTTALSYTNADAGKFTTTVNGTNRTNSILSLAGSTLKTPELYYGIIRVNGGNHNPNDQDCYYWGGGVTASPVTVNFVGRLYRIVSQLNLKITDIPSSLVSKMELYMNHYPKQIILYGGHGIYYPVTAVTSDTNTSGTSFISLASATISNQTSITLSSFLLPSEMGGELKLDITYKNGTIKTFSLRPGKSYFMTGADASVYNVSANLKNGNDLYVYDNRTGKYCFYSYSNVRVNLSGKFENIAAETSEANVVIEVEPNFEKIHQFDII